MLLGAPAPDEPLALLDALDHAAPRAAVDGDLAALDGVELGVWGKPLAQQVGIHERAPDLVSLGGDHQLAHDRRVVHALSSSLATHRLHEAYTSRTMCNQ